MRCAACVDCKDGEACLITDDCPMMWCACHKAPNRAEQGPHWEGGVHINCGPGDD